MKSYSAPPKPYSDSYRNDSEGNKIVKIRALISTKEAGVVIGVKGSHVAEIREATGMRIMVTPHIQNVPDRVMTLSGPLGSLGVAMAMIVTKLLSRNEPNEESEDTVTLRILVPSTRMGFVIGKSGARIKELQANSGAKMYSQNENLPNSTERVMTMIGNADSLQIACYSLAAIIGDQHERPESAMQMLYDPGNALRQPYGMPTNAMYGQSAKGYGGQGNPGYNAQMYNYPQGQNSAMYASYYPQMQMMAQYPHLQAQYQQQYYAAAQAQTDGVSENGQPTPRSTESQTQELTIPNNLVGAIIGKGGSKVKEIRNASGSQIKFADPVEGATDRIVWVTGLPESNARAIYMLHARVEAEKARYAAYPNNHKSH
ncbi:hypothetical protein BC833DRAFT_520967 [Globomyces pollinis-pini]|nr:hypothetical protein BC833DRAFT_520967 [Globomyces pollinis-pini]